MTDAEEKFSKIYAAARSGSTWAFQTLAERYRRDLEQFLDRRGGREGGVVERDDLVQETLLTLFERIQRFPEDLDAEEFKAYLFQIAKWRSSSILQRARRRPPEEALPAPEEASRTGTVTRADERRKLREVVASLPADYASVLGLCVFQGKSTAEAAEILGISRDAVKQRLLRARRAIQGRW